MANEYIEIPLQYELGDVDRNEDSEIVPEGTYLLKLGVRYSPPKDGRDGGLVVSCTVRDAEPANKQYVGAQFVDFITLKPTVKFRMANFLDAIYGRKVDGKSIQLPDLQGAEVAANVIKDGYDNKVRSRVDRYLHKSKWRVAAAVGSSTPTLGPQPPPPQKANGKVASAPAQLSVLPPATEDDGDVEI